MDLDSSKLSKDSSKPDAKVVVITNLTRNVVEAHLQTIFGFYGEIVKIDLPVFGKCMSRLSKSTNLFTQPRVIISGSEQRQSCT